MKILVTGAAGFIGFHICKSLLNKGYRVIGLDNINDYYDTNIKYARLDELGIGRQELNSNTLIESVKFRNLSFVKTDISDSNSINNLFDTEKFDAVCNLAAQAGVRYSIENPHA